MRTSGSKAHLDEVDGRFDRLFSTHHQAIYRYCLRRLGRDEADDATAEVFAVVWRRIGHVPTDETERAWLYTVAYRVVGDRFRGRRRRGLLASRIAAMEFTQKGSIEPAQDHRVDQALAALDQLSATDQELLRLAIWDDLPQSDIARILGITENAVYQRLFRARSRLKARFDRIEAKSSQQTPEEASA